jgi:hypothetical protein
MVKKITYYAMVDDLSSRDQPAGVLRRTEDDEGQQDEAFTRNLEWEYSWSLPPHRDRRALAVTMPGQSPPDALMSPVPGVPSARP